MSVQFDDYSIEVKNALKETAVAFLEEAGGEIEAQTKRNCAVVTSRTKGSFQHMVDESNLECAIGSDYENAIWEEFGTGIYAVNGDGRQGGWTYIDELGVKHFTMGKRPKRMLFNAFQSLQAKIQQMAEERFGGL
ncbi:hypothetical protein [Jutongia sp.]